MKTHFVFTLVGIIFLTSSCSVTKYPHKEVMDKLVIGQTKEEIVANIGIADERRTEGKYDEWIYYGDIKTFTYNPPTNSNTNVFVNPSTNSATVNTRTYGSRSVSRTMTSYVKLTFYEGKVIKWDTKGVDFSIKEQKPGLSLLLLGSIVGAIVLIKVLISSEYNP